MKAWSRYLSDIDKTFTFVATYDIQNRMKEMTYPDSSKITNYYADSGYLRQVRLLGPGQFFGAALVTYEGPETTGATELVRRLGNGVESVISYDDSTRRPTGIQTKLKNGSTVQSLSYGYDNVGNITSITDAVNANRNQAFGYDNLYRLTSAQSTMYGNLSYTYSAGGNLTHKEGVGFFYTQQKLTSTTDGRNYTYDQNGNMTSREGRSLVYDSEDHLIAIQASGIDKANYTYEHSGERIKKTREDGTTVYSIGGLYEVMVRSDGAEYHSRYFYGISGDRLAQITRDSSQVTLAQTSQISKTLYAANFEGSMLAQANLIMTDLFFLTVRSNFNQALLVFFALACALFILILKNKDQARFGLLYRSQSTAALLVFLFVFVFNGCTGETVPPHDPESTPWSDVANEPLPPWVSSLSNPLAIYNDTTTAGQPTIGAFFLVPNHLGSTALVTNASGNSVISEMHYKPYGELVRTQSYGPDNVRHKYTGQEEDSESSLMYYGARYYDPGLGRFISADLINFAPNLTQAYNRYMNVMGNPIRFQDPTGHGFFDWLGDFFSAIVAPITLAVSAVESIATGSSLKDTFSKNFNSLSDTYSSISRGVAYGVAGALVGSAFGALGPIGGGIAGGLYNLATGNGGFWEGFAGGALSGAYGGAFGAAVGGINGFLAGYNDIYSHDNLGLNAFIADSTIGLTTTAIGLGKASIEIFGGIFGSTHYERELSKQSNAYIFTNSVFGRSNAVGNVVSIDKKTSGNRDAKFYRTLREELLHTWQYRRGGLLNQVRLLSEQVGSDSPNGFPYPYGSSGTLEYEASTRSFDGTSLTRVEDGYNGAGNSRPWELLCTRCSRFYP